ncbi:hypothetical protein M758_UG298900 [Ceratodon purpureus]|nr:hypothetical protein M758_UG298900 [Ceratodon purpureus]
MTHTNAVTPGQRLEHEKRVHLTRPRHPSDPRDGPGVPPKLAIHYIGDKFKASLEGLGENLKKTQASKVHAASSITTQASSVKFTQQINLRTNVTPACTWRSR